MQLTDDADRFWFYEYSSDSPETKKHVAFNFSTLEPHYNTSPGSGAHSPILESMFINQCFK